MAAVVEERETAAERRGRTVLKYVPLTGPEPVGLKPGETFNHREVRLDGELASRCLEVNSPENRKPSEDYARAWAKQILAGEWDMITPQALVFDRDGYMIDGQTRCRAVQLAALVQPKAHIMINCEHNWDPKVFAKLDCGRKRTTGQLLRMKNGNNHAANVALYYRYMQRYDDPPVEYTAWRKAEQASTERAITFLDENPDLVRCWDLAHPLKAKAHLSRSAAAVALFLIRRSAIGDPLALEVVHEFANGIADPRRCKDGDPRYALFRYAERTAMRKIRFKLSEPLGLILRSWQFWCEGRQVSSIMWEHGKSKMPDVHVPEDWAAAPRKWGIVLPSQEAAAAA